MSDIIEELDAWIDANWDPELTVAEWWQRLADAGAIRCLRVPMPGSKHTLRLFRRAWVEEFLAANTTGPAK